jgi:MSHA biogenesis protein MshO
MPNKPVPLAQRGFTLIEAIVVMVATSIIAGVVTVFMQAPIEAYFQSVSRAQLADAADAALRFVGRDVRRALPRSFRNPNSNCLEFLPTAGGGRYCGPGESCSNPVNFGSAMSNFGVIGGLNYLPVAGDRIVFHNLGLDAMDAYQLANSATSNVAIAGAGSSSSNIVLSPAKTLPASLAQLDIGTAAGQLPRHFFIVPDSEQAVMYVCDSVGLSAQNGTGRLLRLQHYGVNTSLSSCPSNLSGATVLASNLTRCKLTALAAGLTDRLDVLSVELEITRNGESVRLYQEVQVYNDP